MMNNLESLPVILYKFGLVFIPAIFGIICHEIAHGYVAYRLGDPTAKVLGRLTFNPIKHIDPNGLLVFVLTTIFMPFSIGWAKPVPIQPRYFRDPSKGMMLVSIAGPLANFLIAILCGAILLLMLHLPLSRTTQFIIRSANFGILINCALGWFNLLPIPPLDGSHILGNLLPQKLAVVYQQISRYGLLIIIALLYFNLIGKVLWPLVMNSTDMIYSLFQFEPSRFSPYGFDRY